MKRTFITWPVNNHSLAQASQTMWKCNEATGVHDAIFGLDSPWDRAGSSKIKEEDTRASRSSTEKSPDYEEDDAELGHCLCESPSRASLSQHASNDGVLGSSTASMSLHRGPQLLEFPMSFPRTSRRSSLCRRRALKKIDRFNIDPTEGNAQSSSLEIIGTESASMSHSIGSVVESPDWLPPGWLTEMKTRASGSSAGCKYKCYVDPVTRRRFRTRKEVFCFLRTGNTGRYKPKSKVEQNGEQFQSDAKASLDSLAPVFQSALQQASLAGGTHIHRSSFLPSSWHYCTGRSAYGGFVDIQAAALKLLTDDDDMTLEEKARLFARFSPRPIGLFGLRIPANNFKRRKAEGKEGLEALGKVLCQQGLSILRSCSKKHWQDNA